MNAGRVLADRYELGRLIGRGGMAEVYAAHDRLLDREVAVKVLRERFREDATFTARFNDEARNVARLAHPNLVVVFDTGVDADQPFIVMERIHGRTLQQALDAGGLTEDRGLQVAADVCGALGYAHRNLLVHRDVKPGNIMLADDGSVKVTDFGIARAISDETVTATAAVLGTAAYLSPEQAQGKRVDARSDLYSLGVVLYELLTGRVPFSGDSAVSVALQHVRATPEPPRRLVPTVSKAAETIALRLLEKDPDRRYQSADDVRVDLERARRGEPPLALKPPARAVPAAVRTAPLDASDPTVAVTAVAHESALPVRADAVAVAPAPSTPEERRTRTLGYLALAAVLVAVVLGARAVLTADGGPGADVTVPTVVGSPIEEAVSLLEAAELRIGRINEIETEGSAPGTVLTQRPSAGSVTSAGSAVDVTVAKSPTLTTVPSVAGVEEDEALRRLREAGLVPGARIRAPSDTLPAGTVISTQPSAGTRVAIDTVVEVTISDGPARAPVPRVTLRPLAEAVNRLRDLGFRVEIIEEPSPAVAAGLVIRQDPNPPEEAALGTPVTLWVSTGPSGTEPLPDVPEPDPEPDDDPPADGAAPTG
jgi:beta-lactam-binding protein with PASTA domain/tRNA A-37 threonylcarbamoyl transferase component Bud32